MSSNKSVIGTDIPAYGLTSKSVRSDRSMRLQIVTENELTGTGNTAHEPMPLKASGPGFGISSGTTTGSWAGDETSFAGAAAGDDVDDVVVADGSAGVEAGGTAASFGAGGLAETLTLFSLFFVAVGTVAGAVATADFVLSTFDISLLLTGAAEAKVGVALTGALTETSLESVRSKLPLRIDTRISSALVPRTRGGGSTSATNTGGGSTGSAQRLPVPDGPPLPVTNTWFAPGVRLSLLCPALIYMLELIG